MIHPFNGRCIISVNGHDRFIWEFIPKEVLFARGNEDITIRGIMIEYYTNNPPEKTQYTYNTYERCLYVDKSFYEDGSVIRRFCYRYRIEQIDDNEWNLYYLEDTDNEPPDYGYKMKISRSNS